MDLSYNVVASSAPINAAIGCPAEADVHQNVRSKWRRTRTSVQLVHPLAPLTLSAS